MRDLGTFPRVRFAQLPSPLEPLPRLSQTLGGPRLWVKRDDHLGLAEGGNKVRKLEFLMAEAQARGARSVITFGGVQSNHARQTAAAARRLGMEPVLLLFGKRPATPQGNVLLERLMGARLSFLNLGGGNNLSIEATIRLVQLLTRALPGIPKRNTFFIPVGGHSPVGALGYVNAAFELQTQAEAEGIPLDYVVTAVGTGGTMAGLLAGFRLLGAPTRVIGIDIGRLWKGTQASIARMAAEVTRLLEQPESFTPEDVPLFDYAGEGYAIPSPAGMAAVRLVARTEGLILDPVYTGKAMAGLVNLIHQGYFKKQDTVVFLHTGGLPALFCFAEQFT